MSIDGNNGFSVVKAQDRFWFVKNSNHVDVAMLIPQFQSGGKVISHYHIISLNLNQPTGPVGMTKKQLEKVLSCWDWKKTVFDEWWKTEIVDKSAGMGTPFAFLGDGTVFGAADGHGYVYGNIVNLQIALKTDESKENYAKQLVQDLEMGIGEAVVITNKLVDAINAKEHEFNNSEFNILNLGKQSSLLSQVDLQKAIEQQPKTDPNPLNLQMVADTTKEHFFKELEKALMRADKFVRSHGETLGKTTDRFGICGKIYPGMVLEIEGPNVPHVKVQFDTVKFRTNLTFKYPHREIELNGFPIADITRLIAEAFTL